MAIRASEKATPNFTVRRQDQLNWNVRRSIANVDDGNRLKSKLVLALLCLLSLVWLARIYSGLPLLTSSTINPASRSELELFQGSSNAPNSPEVLECFQVSQPVLSPDGLPSKSTASVGQRAAREDDPDKSCSVLLMDHVFGFSYGKPFVGTYTPPDCPFNRIIMNLTVVSQGRQFDRLALMYFGDTEVWRTSTAEPTQPPGIRWTFLKDMSEYLYFWKSPQKLIFDLGNLLDDKYTGSFNATLTATFFLANAETGKPPADMIIPVSARKAAENGPSHFTLPTENATNTMSLPRNVNRAVFSISANGQAAEEFWWGNVLQSDVDTFSQTTGKLLGLSPFREVQLLIDGSLAGIQWPFPVIFTGGVVPSLHRPIVGLQAFDLREHQIDITPFLPLLCDGAEHTFAIKVAGLNDRDNASTTLTDTVNDSWYVTGKIFLWLDEEGSVTTGASAVVEYDEPTISLSHRVTQNATGFNETLAFETFVERTLTVRSTINSKSYTGESTWSQILSYSNRAVVSNFGFTEINNFTITGVDSSTGSSTPYKTVYTYPLYCNQTVSTSSQGNLTISAHLIQGFQLQVEGSPVFPTGLEAFEDVSATRKGPYAVSHLNTYRDGTAFFSQTGDRKSSFGYGTTNQVFRFGGSDSSGTHDTDGDIDELYFRNVTAANGTILSDSERIKGMETYSFKRKWQPNSLPEASLALFAHTSDVARGFKTPAGKGIDYNGMYELPLVQVQIP
ncbi:uncharacterized protein F4807DRAFT_469395 [Annulohypoxylon truncatum]|uniref:uncharacterized protein n=1 Tax=Annulohypoxylon truncatum TaxID=327061 RepID=UPI0020084D5F|nr:uncharacterized protein F4807DRAFT_469395 [Annulohypoxylon truncatum]KAI1207375.1 hypothetical protein F4807DRAFT_469395 [Annulohypoxylon truncatum]